MNITLRSFDVKFLDVYDRLSLHNNLDGNHFKTKLRDVDDTISNTPNTLTF